MSVKDKSEATNASDTMLPVLVDGESVKIIKLEVVKDQTKPPSRYTEGSLILDMEAAAKFVEDDPAFKKIMKEVKGLGTAATRHTVIEGLKDAGYIKQETQNKSVFLVSTEKGRDFIAWLEKIMPESIDVALTAKWEAELIQIAKTGEYTKFKDNIESYIKTFINNAKSNKPTITTTGETMSENNMPSDKQINFAKLIASKLGIRVPDEVMVDRAACSKFIEDNSAKGLAPSEKQVNFANSIAAKKKLTVPAEALASGKALSAWIDANKD